MATNQFDTLNSALAMQDEAFDLHPKVQQARFGATAQHITQEKQFTGGSMHVKVYKENYQGARVTSNLSADAHYSGSISVVDWEIAQTNFRRIGVPLCRDIIVDQALNPPEHAMFDLAAELALEAAENVGEARNRILNSNGDLVMAWVGAVYDEDGTSYTNGQTDAFIKITKGSVSMFHPGQILHIRDASDNVDETPPGTLNGTQAQIKCVVNDVCPGAFWFGNNVGPGIVVTICGDQADATDDQGEGYKGTDSNFDTVAATNNTTANTDEIALTGEDNDAYPGSFGALGMTGDVSPGEYFGVTRTTKGNAYLIPMGRHWDSLGTGAGTKTALDIETHFRAMYKDFGGLLSAARGYRRNREFALSDSVVCQAHPDLVAEIVMQAGASPQRFNIEQASNMDSAKRRAMFASYGFDGAVLRNSYETIPPIALQPEPLMDNGTIRVFEPSAGTWLRIGSKRVTWAPVGPGASYWLPRRNVTTGNRTMQVDAFGYVMETIFWDQPRLIYAMDGLKDSL